MRALLNRIDLSRGEAGLTIIEVVVAAVVLAVGAMATFGILASAAKNAQRAKASQVSLDLAQEEMERLRAIPYDNLAISGTPTPSASTLSPDSRVLGETFALKRSPVGEYGPLVIAETGFSPKSEFFSGNPNAGGVTGTIYRYVVWRNDSSCSEVDCPGTHDYKQIVVAVQPKKLASQQSERGYVEVQSGRIDPETLNEPPPGEEEEEDEEESGSSVTAQQFYLSDTPCATSGTTTRATIAGDHLLHNTLGTCSSGPQTGSSKPGAPDALLLSGPPDPDPEDETNPALYDYSNDFYLEPTPDTDKGLQIRHDDTSGCHYTPTGTTNPESQVHRWVTDRFAQTFSMSGRVTLEFYTRTLNDALYTGTLCVYLFDRSETTDTFLADKLNGNLYWVYEPEGNGFWPRNMWTKVRLTMEFSPHSVSKDNRLGVALSVDPANTPADAIPIMYDHPNYPSRIEVDTTTPIEGG
jgi:type II secretory pathway pseudopilin PulG